MILYFAGIIGNKPDTPRIRHSQPTFPTNIIVETVSIATNSVTSTTFSERNGDVERRSIGWFAQAEFHYASKRMGECLDTTRANSRNVLLQLSLQLSCRTSNPRCRNSYKDMWVMRMKPLASCLIRNDSTSCQKKIGLSHSAPPLHLARLSVPLLLVTKRPTCPTLSASIRSSGTERLAIWIIKNAKSSVCCGGLMMGQPSKPIASGQNLQLEYLSLKLQRFGFPR
jgi:hypothetical protein